MSQSFHRGRRLRWTPEIRSMVRETPPLLAEDLIMPYFVVETEDQSFRKEIGAFGMMEVVVSSIRSLIFGLVGSLVGVGILFALTELVGPVEGSMVRGFVYTAAAGLPALLATYGGAYLLHQSEAPFFDALFDKAARLLRRA